MPLVRKSSICRRCTCGASLAGLVTCLLASSTQNYLDIIECYALDLTLIFGDLRLLVFFLQGVLKIRKRVTLMVITVSVIFGVCYFGDSTIFLLAYYAPTHTVSDVAHLASVTMILFNSAINPIVYALLNFKFRLKVKAMIC